MPRALTIISRHKIFSNNVAVEEFDEEKVTAILRAWFGFSYDEKYAEHIEKLKIEGWLDKYMRGIFFKDLAKKFKGFIEIDFQAPVTKLKTLKDQLKEKSVQLEQEIAK